MTRRFPGFIRLAFLLICLLILLSLAYPVYTAFAAQSGQVEPTPALRTALPRTSTSTVATITASWTPTPTTRKPTLTPTLTSTPTPLPDSYLENDFQTASLLTGAVVLMIIILGGTVIGIRRR